MDSVDGLGENAGAIFVDMGTTNTRIFLMRGSEVVTRAIKPVGVRDTARDGTTSQIRTALRELITDATRQAKQDLDSFAPACVAAAGMISSPLGLAELSHVATPAGVLELAASSRWFQFPDVTDLPVLLIPGVRSGPTGAARDFLDKVDVMRGEETLCMGLIALGLAKPPSVVLNLGSHWKAIRLDAQGRIESSISSLSGELIHAAQTQTILTSAVPRERPMTMSQEWVDAGIREQRRAGLSRALFCVRLLELANEGTPEDRLAFLVGAFVGEDRDGLVASGMLNRDSRVVIAGGAAVAHAWQSVLVRMGMPAVVLTAPEVETALLAGLRRLLDAAAPAPRSVQ